jgi:16S rRNA (cytosine1402-N4)-methyltransferase
MNTYDHIPVLLSEALEYLDPRPNQNFVDATLGGGGYTSALLDKIKPDGKVLAVDLDEDAISNFQFPISNFQNRAILVHGNFARIDKIVVHHQFNNISGIVADLGLSSHELENRGMSFQKKEPLDMRFDRSKDSKDAKLIVNDYLPEELVRIFREYGEDPFAKQIARKIIENRNKKIEIKYTTDLYQIIQDSLPKPIKHKADDHARRIFQALRIEVNQELQSLQEFLPKAFDLLVPGGRMAIVSFHSLEDRMVKQFFLGLAKGCVCPPDFPQCICGKNPKGKILTKKPVTASQKELSDNPRSRPAKLRAIIKL